MGEGQQKGFVGSQGEGVLTMPRRLREGGVGGVGGEDKGSK